MLSHDELVKNMTEAARRGEDVFTVLSAATEHLIDCQICVRNTAEIVQAIFVEAELKQDSDVDPADLSQEAIEPLLQFPSFDMSFLSGAPSRETLAQRASRRGEEMVRAWEMPLPDRGSLRVHAAQEPTPAQQSSPSTAQFSQQEEMTSKVAAELIADARALEESGDLAKAQFTYEIARTRMNSKDAVWENLDTRIRELQQRIRVENQLEHEANAAQTLEKNGKWREAEDAYRQLAAKTSTPKSRDAFMRAAARCRAEREIDDLFDSGLKAFNSKDLVAAMNRLKRVIRQRPGYVRGGIAAETILAQARKEWESRLEQASTPRIHKFRLVLVGGLVFLLVFAVWNFAVPYLAPAKATAPTAATLTLISPDSLPSQLVAPASGILPANTIQTGTTVAPQTTTPTVIPARPPAKK